MHAGFTAAETGELLAAAEAETAARPEEDDDRCLARIGRRDYERSRKLPTDFVAAWARDRILSNEVWRAARGADDFAAYRPHLEKMVDYARRAADYYGYAAHPYDALLDLYEPGATTIAGETTQTFTSCERVTYLEPAQLGQFALSYSGFPMSLSLIEQGQCSLTYTIRWSFPLPA